MVFVTLLAIAVGTLSAIALVMVGLVEAPWQLLLLGLLAALYALQRQVGASEPLTIGDSHFPASLATPKAAGDQANASAAAEAETGSGDTESSKDSYELTYRGIRYSSTKPSADDLPSDRGIDGVYRGQPWHR